MSSMFLFISSATMFRNPTQLRPTVCATCRLRACLAGLRDQRARGFALETSHRLQSRIDGESWIGRIGRPRTAAGVDGEGRRLRECRRRDGQLEALGSRRDFSTAMRRSKQPDEAHSASTRYEEQRQLDGSDDAIVLDKRDDGVWELDEEDLEDDLEDGQDVEEQESYMTSAELNEDKRLLDDLRAAQMSYALEAQDEAADQPSDDFFQRTHPLTAANRFGTSPSTLPLPSNSLVEPIASLLANVSSTHLSEAAHRLFGGVGLPYSTSTPLFAKTMQQKPIALEAGQGRMSEMEGNVFLATLMPGMYAAIMSVLVETRKRLGSAWAEGLVQKAARGELRILDAGGAGAGVLAVREMLRAEWERMHEEDVTMSSVVALAEADGKVGGPGLSPPLGSATVLTGSDILRHRASRLLDNTTFVPRLPDYAHTEEAKKKGKFDFVIAPHTLWPLREDYIRKPHVDNLWSLLSSDGGVLVLLEKGNARGFEVVAGARQFLLDNRIASPDVVNYTDQPDPSAAAAAAREPSCIIAPCTNHSSCPMYKPQGVLKGRSDICHFSQRYVRTPIQQRILRARDKNFEDVKFSYLAVQRGRDLRSDLAFSQGAEATDAAFRGYLNSGSSGRGDIHSASDDGGATAAAAAAAADVPNGGGEVHSLTLPRAILPPLKRRGHVILDLCTPTGSLERWTVPRSFSKQAFRDARKSEWGDLWALGAKTRVLRTPRMRNRHGQSPARSEKEAALEPGTAADSMGRKTAKVKAKTKTKTSAQSTELVEDSSAMLDDGDADADSMEMQMVDSGDTPHSVSRGLPGHESRPTRRKVKGIRDKRDKKGDGRGRRKNAKVASGEWDV